MGGISKGITRYLFICESTQIVPYIVDPVVYSSHIVISCAATRLLNIVLRMSVCVSVSDDFKVA